MMRSGWRDGAAAGGGGVVGGGGGGAGVFSFGGPPPRRSRLAYRSRRAMDQYPLMMALSTPAPGGAATLAGSIRAVILVKITASGTVRSAWIRARRARTQPRCRQSQSQPRSLARPQPSAVAADGRGTGESQEPAERTAARRISAYEYGPAGRHADDALHAGRRPHASPAETHA